MREDDDGRLLVDLGEVLLQPLALRRAHLEGALPVVVEPGHDRHALLGRVALGRPEILLDHAVQHDEVDALVVEGVVVGPEHLLPLLAQVEVPVVLADHHPDGRLEVLQDLLAERELVGAPELREISAEEHEIRLRIECVHVLHRLRGRPREAVRHAARVEVRIGDIGEAERDIGIAAPGRRGVRDVHELEAVERHQARRRRHTRELERRAQEVPSIAVLERSEQPLVRGGALGERALDLFAGHVVAVHGLLLRPTSARASRARRSARDRCS